MSLPDKKISKNRYWNEYLQTMPREKLDQYHLKRIQLAIKYAYENSPLHRKIYEEANIRPEDIKTWDDFYHKLPFTDKPQYMEVQETSTFAAQALHDESSQYYFQTTGTTGKPFREIFSLYDTAMLGEQWCYAWWDAGIRPADKFYFCFDWGIWIGLWSAYWGCRRMGCTVYSGGGLRTEERLQRILELKPTVVTATPTYLLYMANIAEEQGLNIKDAGVKFLTGGGEAGFNIPATRRVLESKWGAICVDFFGIGELGHGAVECGAHPGGVHVCEPHYHAFAIDPESGERVKEGLVGEYVVTTYSHTMQPFIKYKTHDLVEWHSASDHGCGWSWAYLPGGVLGRADFMIVIRGVNVYPTAVENLLTEVEGLSNFYELHITREKGMDRLLIKVEALPEIAGEAHQQISLNLAEVYRKRIGVALEAQVVAPQTLPRYELKSKRIFDHRSPEEKGRKVL